MTDSTHTARFPVPPYRRLPLRVQIGQQAVQTIGYLDTRQAQHPDEDVQVAALVTALRHAADNLQATLTDNQE